MSSLINRTREAKPMSRIRSRAVAGVTAIAISGAAAAAAVVATAAPAQARPRSCMNIMQSMMFFELAMELDTGVSAQYFAQDSRMFNYEVRLYNNAGC